jgi:virginiamycin A acetyltransferase
MAKLFIKRLLFLIGLVLVSPLVFLTYLESIIFGKSAEKAYSSCKELLSMCPTFLGPYLRLGYYRAVCTKISPDADFQFGSMVAHRDTVIRAGAVIGSYSIIGCADIGENVLIAARVSIISGKYQHGKPRQRAEDENATGEYSLITVGNNSWIGEGAIIMADIGSNCTVGAGSVVMKEVPNNSTVMGNPARKVSLG